MNFFPDEEAALDDNSRYDEELTQLYERQRIRLEKVAGVTGVGIATETDGSPLIMVYCLNSTVAAKIPKTIEGVPIKTVITGDIDAL